MCTENCLQSNHVYTEECIQTSLLMNPPLLVDNSIIIILWSIGKNIQVSAVHVPRARATSPASPGYCYLSSLPSSIAIRLLSWSYLFPSLPSLRNLTSVWAARKGIWSLHQTSIRIIDPLYQSWCIRARATPIRPRRFFPDSSALHTISLSS